MVFEHIEKLKRDYTDKYVVVDGSRPELARFKGSAGRVKTVNMSGKALVEFPEHANIGWYDIDVDYLKVVERPVPKTEDKKAAPKKKPATKPVESATAGKKLSPLELARMQGAAGSAKPAPQESEKVAEKPTGKMSTSDVLAAARGKAAAAQESAPKAEQTAVGNDPAQMSVADKIAMLRGEKGAAPAPAASKPAAAKPAAGPAKDLSEMTLQEKLAYMRGENSGGAAAEDKSTQPESQQDEPTKDEPADEPADDAAAPAATDAPAKSGESVDRSSMSVSDMLAWCRQHDAG